MKHGIFRAALTVTMLFSTHIALLGFSLPSSPQPTSSIPQHLWAVVGDDSAHLDAERAAGITTRVVRLSWREFSPTEASVNMTYVERKREFLAQIRDAQMGIILELGFHDPPAWVRAYPDSHYVNQYGEVYDGGGADSGDVNFVFNPWLRTFAARYIGQIFTAFGTDFAAVRIGGGHWGELTYPTHIYKGKTNCYWGFDANAAATNPVPEWRPGQPSPDSEAAIFADWYLNALVRYEGWQVATVRSHYTGMLMLLFPSWGIRPGQVQAAIAHNLDGTTSAEVNGEVQRGYDFARQVAAISDAKVVVTTTWLDAPSKSEDTGRQRDWTPVKYLASLAWTHPLQLRLFGENTGNGSANDMRYAAAQMQRYGLIGMAWFNDEQLYSRNHATFDDYRQIIQSTDRAIA